MQRNLNSVSLIVNMCIVACLVFAAYPPGECHAEDNKKIALFPFIADDAGQYAVLKDGLTAMLSGRLAVREGITLVESTLSEQQRQEFAAGYPETSVMNRLGVEYIGSGRMVAEGDLLHLRIQLYADNETMPEKIEVTAVNDQEIVAAVDRLASRIALQIVGGVAQNNSAVDDTVQQQEQGLQAFQTEHPDRRYKEEIVSGAAIYTEDAGMAVSRGSFARRSTNLQNPPVAVAQEDINKDGVDEIVLLSSTALEILQYDRGIVKEISRFDLEPSLEVHAMNLADLVDDRQSEIYISAVKNGRFASMILTWSQQQGFRTVMENIRYGIRPIELPGEGTVLAGQARGMRQASSMADDAFLKPGVFRLEMDWRNGTVEKGKTISLPSGINLFDFVIGDLDSDGFNETIAIARNMKMVVYGPDHRMRWQSEKEYGGSLRYLGSRWQNDDDKIPTGNPDQDGKLSLELQYLPVQLRLADSNGDGNMDIISARNKLAMDKILRLFPNLRSFSTGQVVCLTWKNGGMVEVWRTEAMNGHVASFDFVIKEDSAMEMADTINVRLVLGHSAGKGLEEFLSFNDGQDTLLVYNFSIGSQNPASLEKTTQGIKN